MAKKGIFYSPPRGMRDMLPDEHSVASYIKKVIRYRCRQSGIRRITTPIFERPVIVDHLPQGPEWGQKVTFNVTADSSNELVLRSGFTWGIWRAYVTHKMVDDPQPQELYALDLCFATDTQQGNLLVKQYLGFDIEIMGEEDPALDAQLLKLWQTVCEDVGMKNELKIQLSKVGNQETRKQFLLELEQYYLGKERSLCAQCRVDAENKNFLALLNCKEEDCQILAKLAPRLEKYFTAELKDFYQNIEEYLSALGVDYEWVDNLFPTNYPFFQPLYGEILLGEKKVGYIGHYQNILAEGEETGISGRSMFINLEDVINVMRHSNIFIPFKDNIHVYVAQLGPEAKKKSLELLYQLRNQGIKVIGSMGKGSMQEQADLAYKFRIPYCILIGRMEVEENTIIVRDMKTGKRESVAWSDINEYFLSRIPPVELDRVRLEKTSTGARMLDD